jgi:hypothetical protein
VKMKPPGTRSRICVVAFGRSLKGSVSWDRNMPAAADGVTPEAGERFPAGTRRDAAGADS